MIRKDFHKPLLSLWQTTARTSLNRNLLQDAKFGPAQIRSNPWYFRETTFNEEHSMPSHGLFTSSWISIYEIRSMNHGLSKSQIVPPNSHSLLGDSTMHEILSSNAITMTCCSTRIMPDWLHKSAFCVQSDEVRLFLSDSPERKKDLKRRILLA